MVAQDYPSVCAAPATNVALAWGIIWTTVSTVMDGISGIWDTNGYRMKRREESFFFWHDRIHLVFRKSKHIQQLRTKYANLWGPPWGTGYDTISYYISDFVLRGHRATLSYHERQDPKLIHQRFGGNVANHLTSGFGMSKPDVALFVVRRRKDGDSSEVYNGWHWTPWEFNPAQWNKHETLEN